MYWNGIWSERGERSPAGIGLVLLTATEVSTICCVNILGEKWIVSIVDGIKIWLFNTINWSDTIHCDSKDLSAQLVETSVTVYNSRFQDYSYDYTPPSDLMTPGFIPFVIT